MGTYTATVTSPQPFEAAVHSDPPRCGRRLRGNVSPGGHCAGYSRYYTAIRVSPCQQARAGRGDSLASCASHWGKSRTEKRVSFALTTRLVGPWKTGEPPAENAASRVDVRRWLQHVGQSGGRPFHSVAFPMFWFYSILPRAPQKRSTRPLPCLRVNRQRQTTQKALGLGTS